MISAKLLIRTVLKLKAVDQTFIGMWHSVTSMSVLNGFATLECVTSSFSTGRESVCVCVSGRLHESTARLLIVSLLLLRRSEFQQWRIATGWGEVHLTQGGHLFCSGCLLEVGLGLVSHRLDR